MRNNEDRFGTNRNIQDSSGQQLLSNTDNGQSLSLNFIVPTEYIDLPSKGRFYPVEHPLHGKDTIEVKQMTAKEEDILTSRSLLKKGVALDKLIESLLVNKNINPDSLTVEDRNAIIVSARISGYGPEYNTMVTCPSCNTKSKFSFDLSQKLPSSEDEEASPDFQLNERGQFQIELPVTKWKVVCRALNGYDEKKIFQSNEVKKKSLGDSTLVEQFKLLIVSIQGVTDPDTLQTAIMSLPAGDSRFLRKTYSQIVTPLDLKQTFTCSSCEYEADMEVPLSADFFWFK